MSYIFLLIKIYISVSLYNCFIYVFICILIVSFYFQMISIFHKIIFVRLIFLFSFDIISRCLTFLYGFPMFYLSLIINLSVASHLYSPRKLSVLFQSFVKPPSTRNKKFIFLPNTDILDIPIFQDHCLRMLNCLFPDSFFTHVWHTFYLKTFSSQRCL